MDEAIKAKDTALWQAFTANGVLPEPALSEDEALALLRRQDAPFILLLQAGRTLERVQGAAVDTVSQVRIANAFMSVLRTTQARKRHYIHREAMARSLGAIAEGSVLPLVKINYGFWRMRNRLAEAPEDEAPAYARQARDLMMMRLAAEPDSASLSCFLNLGMAVLRELSGTDRTEEDRLLEVLRRAPKDAFWEKRLQEFESRLATRSATEPVETFCRVCRTEAGKPHPSSLALGEALQRLMALPGTEAWTGCAFGEREPLRLRVFGVLAPWLSQNRLPPDDLLQRRILELLSRDGLNDAGQSRLYRRHVRRTAGGNRLRGLQPSLGERLGRGVYVLCRECFGTGGAGSEADRALLTWAEGFLKRLLDRYPEDEWTPYRLGRIMLWAGHTEALKNELLPMLRDRLASFWLWDLLGAVYPEKRRSCVARALLCGGHQERYMKSVYDEAERLGLPRGNPSLLKEAAREAEACLHLRQPETALP